MLVSSHGERGRGGGRAVVTAAPPILALMRGDPYQLGWVGDTGVTSATACDP